MASLRGEITENIPPQPVVTEARVDRDITQSMMDAIHEKGVYDPIETGGEATVQLVQQRMEWAEEGATVVFTSGVFDLLHPNHRAYLLHTKLEAVPFHFDKVTGEKGAWDGLSEVEKMAYCQEVLTFGEIKLVVSVDGDAAVADRKGLKEEKGGTLRPIYSWQSRARDVLAATTSIKLAEQDISVPIADAVTIHDNVNKKLTGTPHDDILSIARLVEPDVWSIYYESQDIFDRLEGAEGAPFVNTEVVKLPGHEFYTDELLGGRFSTTAISKRLGGVAAKNGTL